MWGRSPFSCKRAPNRGVTLPSASTEGESRHTSCKTVKDLGQSEIWNGRLCPHIFLFRRWRWQNRGVVRSEEGQPYVRGMGPAVWDGGGGLVEGWGFECRREMRLGRTWWNGRFWLRDVLGRSRNCRSPISLFRGFPTRSFNTVQHKSLSHRGKEL